MKPGEVGKVVAAALKAAVKLLPGQNQPGKNQNQQPQKQEANEKKQKYHIIT